ncbi:hypothetical protein QUF64_09455 [Anaerolineales bacterium HSG6]|nr:hypothetical protein [Anaerolineales bacterium HSG6]
MAKRKRKPARRKKKRNPITPLAKPAEPEPTPPPLDPNLPSFDYLEDKDLDDLSDVDQIVADITLDIEMGYFLKWEAITRWEHGQRLSQAHKTALDDIADFSRKQKEPVLYINEMARPCEPWYETVRKVLPRLVLEKIDTTEEYYETTWNGWPVLANTLVEHGQDLSVPSKVRSPLNVISLKIQHHLWLQYSLSVFAGLGTDEELSLTNEEQLPRLENFIELLEKCKASVAFFKLTLDGLLGMLILPEQDEMILRQELLSRLALPSADVRLADYL